MRGLRAARAKAAALLRRLADRLDPPQPSLVFASEGSLSRGVSIEVEAIGPSDSRFEVVKIAGRKYWSIYDGPKGAKARDRFLHEKKHDKDTITVFVHDGQVRDYWPRTAKAFAQLRALYPRSE